MNVWIPGFVFAVAATLLAVVVMVSAFGRVRAAGRIQGFRLAVQAIGVVAHRYAQGDPTVLEPFEADVAQALGAALPDIVEGYAREQASNVTPIGSKLK